MATRAARLAVDHSLLDGEFASSSMLSVGGMSTREPLRQTRDPHPLLPPLRTLLTTLNIPLAPTSLAIVTPTLLLTVLEALLETRIEDVPDDWRGSWAREKRRAVVEVLVKAIDEVVSGLTRSVAVDETGRSFLRWSSGEVDVEQVVRGREDEIAKLVAGLLEIAEVMGIPDLGTGSSPYDLDTPKQPTFQAYPRNSTLPTISPSTSSSLSIDATPTPTLLFAPRPLYPRRTEQPPAPVFANSRARSALSASSTTTSSTSSSRSAQTRHSASTSLTVPSKPRSSSSRSSTTARPSLVSELAQSGCLSPPPGSPRRPRTLRSSAGAGEGDDSTGEIRARSTLELLKRLAAQKEREEEADRARELEQRRVEQACRIEEQTREAKERRRRKGKGKEREIVPSSAEESGVASETPCCDGCGAAVHGRRARSTRDMPTSSTPASTSSSRSTSPSPAAASASFKDTFASSDPVAQPRSSKVSPLRHRRSSSNSAHAACTCHARPADADASAPRDADTRHRRARSEAPALVGGSIGASTAASAPAPRRRIRVARSAAPHPPAAAHRPRSHSSDAPPSDPDQSQLPPAARPSPTRERRRLADDVAELSVHGESEIEAFERLRRGGLDSTPQAVQPDHLHASSPSHSAPADAPTAPPPDPTAPTTPRAAPVGTHASAAPARALETPSPYTLMLLAERERLRQKLAVLQRRERDRAEAATERAGVGHAVGGTGTEGERVREGVV
ncbi:hypothetical protein JCM10207_002680 [Rhodosporidiobolus poonsookiae]